MAKIQCYAINLPKDTHRLENIKKQFEGKEEIATLHIVEAIYGKTDPQVQEIYNANQKQSIEHYGHTLTTGEIACFLSHQKALRQFLESNEECAVILEDDAILTQAFWDNINTLIGYYQENIPNALVNLRPHKRKKYFVAKLFDRFKVVKHFRVAAGAVGYLISRKVAAELIQMPTVLSYDKMLQRYWEATFVNYATVPNFVEYTPFESAICTHGNATRGEQRKSARKQIGFLPYKFNRIRIVLKHDISDLKYNIKTFGVFHTIKVWLGCKK